MAILTNLSIITQYQCEMLPSTVYKDTLFVVAIVINLDHTLNRRSPLI